MHRTVRWGSQEWVVTGWSSQLEGKPVDLRDRGRARELFGLLVRNPANAGPLREALREAAPGSGGAGGAGAARVGDAAFAEQLAAHAAAGRIRLLTVGAPVAYNLGDVEETQQQRSERPPPKQARPKTWVKFKVVDDASGHPVSGCRLRITTPDGNENLYTTNASGLVEITDIDRGRSSVRGDLKEVTRANTLDFKGMGEPASPDPDAQRPSRQGTCSIAEVRTHKVKTGESLDLIAKENGITWKDLARFNWGTDVPEKINFHLRWDVGCTKTTPSGNNYKFDTSDDPGLIQIPGPFLRENLGPEELHVIRVSPVPPLAAWFFSI